MTHLARLVEYSIWANGVWIEFIATWRPFDEYLLGRMSHILLGERAWLQRVAGESPDSEIWKVLPIPELRAVHAEHAAALTRELDQDLARVIDYTRFTGETYASPAADLLLHVVLHGAHHRGQMAAYASAQGLQPVNTDYVQFCLTLRL